MTPNEFVIWFNGFAEAANNFTLTPKQWDDVKDKLSSVVLEKKIKGTRYNLDNSNWRTKDIIQELIYKYPNDTELGKEVRKIYK